MTALRLVLRRLMPSAVLLAALSALLAVSTSPAAAAQVPTLVSYGNFTAEGPGVAVDAATGDVYTAGLFTYCENPEYEEIEPCSFGGPLHEFTAEGSRLATFGPSENYNVSAAVNPVNKDLYVLTAVGSIEEYEPSTGTVVSSFSVPPSSNFFGSLTIVQIATDAAGDVYVPVAPENDVLEYSETGTLLKTFTGTGTGTLSYPTGVAVDSSGDLWVADHRHNRIEELSPSDAPMGEIESEGTSSVALGAEGTVLSLAYSTTALCNQKRPPCLHLLDYSSTGTKLADVGAGTIERARGFSPQDGQDAQVAVNLSTGIVYVSDISRQAILMFGPPKAPTAERELTVDLTSSGADLGAMVNAGGLPTGYRFEYGPTTAYGSVAPEVEGEAAGTSPHVVWGTVDGLTPGTTYHFRVVAHNALGTVYGEDQTFTTPAAQGVCPNEELRTSFSAALPDCRAYEMVTQPNKDSAEPDSPKGKGIEIKGGWDFDGGGFTSNHAARNGDRFAFWALEVMPEAQSSGMEYLATRGEGGWTSESLIPLASYDNNFCTEVEYGDAMQAFSSQLTAGVIRVGANSQAGTSNIVGNSTGGCNAEGLEVVSGEPLGTENLLIRNNLTDSYQLVNTPPSGAVPTDAHFEGSSSELNRVFFKENTRLTENGPRGIEALYELNEGKLHLVSELPDGEAVAGSLAARWKARPSVISSDGSHVFFTSEGKLYERIDGERTVQLDKAEGAGAGGGGDFQAASATGEVAYFLDEASAGLTGDTVAGSGTNVYRYSEGQLTDVTPDADVEAMNVLGASEGGVYFSAEGVLTSAPNASGEAPSAGKYNIYEWNNGRIAFIATGSGSIVFGGWTVSPNGAYLAFETESGLMGFNDFREVPEIYLYSEGSKQLACASCSPIGEAPSAGGATLPLTRPNEGNSETAGEDAPHELTDGGRLFFQTAESLLPNDTNGEMDVYEYEGGQLHLISSGSADSAAQLLDVSEEGKDVFFVSRQPLVPQDLGGEGESNIIYDAREDGGFPAPALAPSCTTAESCRAPASPQPSVYGTPASQAFSGAGNVVSSPATKPKATKKGKHRKKRKGAGKRHKRKVASCRRHERGAKRKACVRGARTVAGGRALGLPQELSTHIHEGRAK